MYDRLLKRAASLAMTAILTAGMILLPPFSSYTYADEEYEKDSISLETKIKSINGEGDLVLELKREDLENAGFSVGDEVKIKIKAYDYSEKMPYFNNDSDSVSDECALITDGNNAALSVAKGSFAEDEELFTLETGKNGEKIWKDENGESGIGNKVKVYLHEKGEYLKQYNLRNPERSNNREDYSSGSKYANFREIRAGSIGEGVLFRSSSPINDAIGRAEYSAKRMEKAGVKTVINLSDSRKEAQKFIKESKNTYYGKLLEKGNVLCLDLNYDFDGNDFKKGMAEAVRFMSLHEGPYLIHCTEGKDRTGLLSALLEALMGASVNEMTDDYMKTYTNFYEYSSESDEFEYAKKNYLKEVYRAIGGVDSNSGLSNMDYHASAVKYLKEGGSSDAEIAAVTGKLKGNGENLIKVIDLNSGAIRAGENGIFYSDRSGSVISVYSGKAVKPGRSSLCVNGSYVYNKRDYSLSFKDNTHAGRMTAIFSFKKKSDMYKGGIKKIEVYYTIDPKKADESNVKVKLNKKKTDVKTIRDLDRDERIRAKYYSVDMKKREVTFNGDYTGKVVF